MTEEEMKIKQAAKSRRAQRLNDRGAIFAPIRNRREQLGLGVRISVPRTVLTDWREDLDSALVLLQEIQGVLNDNSKRLDISSVLDGAHALVDRVMDGVESFEKEQMGERAPEGK